MHRYQLNGEDLLQCMLHQKMEILIAIENVYSAVPPFEECKTPTKSQNIFFICVHLSLRQPKKQKNLDI